MKAALLVLAVIVGVGGAAALVVRSRLGAHGDEMRAALARDIEEGGLAGLTRAEGRARHLLVADPEDREAAATLGFVRAVLTAEYGVEAAGELHDPHARSRDRSRSSEAAAGVAAATRALALLGAGDPERAARVALAAAEAAPVVPHPLYALGRARTRTGDLAGAAQALQAALLRAPAFFLAEVALAETALDGGDAQAARATLTKVLGRVGGDLPAQLLLGEAERALGLDGAPTDVRACDGLLAAADRVRPPQRWPPAYILAGCELARASRARALGHRAEALVRAEEAGRLAPAEPRLLARTANLLAQLGQVDFADGLLGRARRLGGAQAPQLAWAAAAVELGRGRAPLLPRGPRPPDPETRLLVARAALSGGGVGALRAALAAFGASAREQDADLRALAQLLEERPAGSPRSTNRGAGGSGGGVPAALLDPADPFGAYLDGLRAELAGDLPAALASYRRALADHGDACHAAGEYLATSKLLKQAPDPAALTLLRAQNGRCVNLH